MTSDELNALFEKWVRKLRIVPAWDVRLELVEDAGWRKTGDIRIDCDDRKAVLMLNQRGFAKFVLCRDCGFVPSCPSCSTSLTFHWRERRS